MYFLSKFIWFFLSPINFIIILILLAFLFRVLNYIKFSKFFIFSSIIFFIIIGFLPTGSFMLFNLEKKYHSKDMPFKVDGLLILGGPSDPGLTKVHDQVSFNEAGERLTEAVYIIKKLKPKKIIFSGGIVNSKFEDSHAYVAKKFFEDMEINTKEIIFEYESRNTFENIIFSKKIAQPLKIQKWLVITSSFHMLRVINIAEKVNWHLIPYPVDFRTGTKINFGISFNFLKNIKNFDLAFHEYIGLISYYLLNRTDRIF